MADKVFLFQGAFLAVPESMEDGEAAGGVDGEAAGAAFGGQDYCTVPSIEPPAGMPDLPLAAGEPGPADTPTPRVLKAAFLDKKAPFPGGWKLLPLRQIVGAITESASRAGLSSGVGEEAAFGMLRAYHILQWRSDSRFCGSCGSPNEDSASELARTCPRCGRIEYPRISPAVITLIRNDKDEALLAHNGKFKENVYSLIAGFAEAGESLESAIVREIKEEVNISVRDIRYIASQPWPFPNSLMLGFTARYAGGEVRPDGQEITDAGWFSAQSLREGQAGIPSPGSISRYIINKWLDGGLA